MMRKMTGMAGGLRVALGQRIVLLLAALALLPVFVGSPCGSIHTSQEIAAPYANRAPQWSADGQSIVVNLGAGIYRVSAAGDSMARIPRRGEFGQFSPSLSPDGRVVYLDATASATRVNVIGGWGIKRSIYTGRFVGAPAWSPDGKHIAFNAPIGDSISEAKITTARGSVIARHEVRSGARRKPVWSNDGKQAAFSWNCWRRCMVTVLDIGGNGRTVVDAAVIAEPGKPAHETEGTLSSVAWSPDDRTIYYALKQGRHLPTVLYSTNLSTMETKRISDLSTDKIRDIDISPDGSKLIFAPYRLFVINTDGTGRREILAEEALYPNIIRYTIGSWSPDGSRIAVSSGNALFTIAPDGSDLRALTGFDDDGNRVPANAKTGRP